MIKSGTKAVILWNGAGTGMGTISILHGNLQLLSHIKQESVNMSPLVEIKLKETIEIPPGIMHNLPQYIHRYTNTELLVEV